MVLLITFLLPALMGPMLRLAAVVALVTGDFTARCAIASTGTLVTASTIVATTMVTAMATGAMTFTTSSPTLVAA
jgi:hypothetical protein